jgi:anti-sigma factor RsiW
MPKAGRAWSRRLPDAKPRFDRRHPTSGSGGCRREEEDGMSADERPYITCHELLDFLYLYLENELPDESRHEFERHLAVCDACRDYIHQYQTAIRLGKAAYARPDDPCGDDTPEELVQAILRSRARSGS